MVDKLFFGEVEAQGAKAVKAYMAARGPHKSEGKVEQKKVDVKIDEVPGRNVRDGGY